VKGKIEGGEEEERVLESKPTMESRGNQQNIGQNKQAKAH
jgi:hypothetical protein